MTGRKVPEWVAYHPDQAIPPRVKLRIWERCGGRCALTNRKLRPGDAYDFDHIIALANGGPHAESNLQLVSKAAHREKTKADVRTKAKIQRTAKKHLGLGKAKGKLKGQGFRGWRRFDGAVVWKDTR